MEPGSGSKELRWLIYSREHNAWWKPNECGYTRLIYNAGRYSLDEANKIVADANIAQPHDDPNEFAMLAPECAISVVEAWGNGYDQGRRETAAEEQENS